MTFARTLIVLVVADRRHYAADHVFDSQPRPGCWTLELTYSGTMLRRSGEDRAWRPQPKRTLLLTKPELPYSLRGRAAGEEIWCIFEPRAEYADCLRWPVGCCGIPQLSIPPGTLGREVLRAFEDLHSYLSAVPRRPRLAENALERLLLLAAELAGVGETVRDARIQRALAAVHGQVHAPWTVDALAAAAGLSASHFAHLFRREIGMAPMAWVESVRLEQAQSLLLRTDLRIGEVAARVGFDDACYFSTRFRCRYGCSPRAWRRRPAAEPPPVSARGDRTGGETSAAAGFCALCIGRRPL